MDYLCDLFSPLEDYASMNNQVVWFTYFIVLFSDRVVISVFWTINKFKPQNFMGFIAFKQIECTWL